MGWFSRMINHHGDVYPVLPHGNWKVFFSPMLENTRDATTLQKQAVIATMGCVNAYCSGSPMMERRTRRAHGVCQASLKLKHPFSVRFFLMN